MTRYSLIFATVLCAANSCFGQTPVQPPPCQSSANQSATMTQRAQPTELELLAVDVGRRAVLARNPKAAKNPMQTLALRVRPEGDVVHLYSRVRWTFESKTPYKYYEAEIFTSMIYTPDVRRIIDISYKDNRLHPWRIYSREVDLASIINEDLERRDPLRMPVPLVGNRQDVLAPRNSKWIHHPLQGDHAWHASAADDYISPRWRRAEPGIPTR